ncbi:MAG: hypothetical protein M3P51_03660 [Chloroflexota bacterium]|nr:hypothetical protein [Chloroflexota bacterium]
MTLRQTSEGETNDRQRVHSRSCGTGGRQLPGTQLGAGAPAHPDGEEGASVGEAVRAAHPYLRRPGSLGGIFLLGTGLLTCHLPVTLGVMTAVFAGTALGAFLAANLMLVGVAVTAYSAIAIALGFGGRECARRSATGELR